MQRQQQQQPPPRVRVRARFRQRNTRSTPWIWSTRTVRRRTLGWRSETAFTTSRSGHRITLAGNAISSTSLEGGREADTEKCSVTAVAFASQPGAKFMAYSLDLVRRDRSLCLGLMRETILRYQALSVSGAQLRAPNCCCGCQQQHRQLEQRKRFPMSKTAVPIFRLVISAVEPLLYHISSACPSLAVSPVPRGHGPRGINPSKSSRRGLRCL